jgi:hypothetical protein
MIRSSSLFVLSLVVAAGCRQGPSAPKPIPNAKLRIELSTDSRPISPGGIPDLNAVLINDGPEAAVIVLPGDGSVRGLRSPIVRWNPPMVSAGCGNIDRLMRSELVTLEAGDRIHLSRAIGWPELSKPGKQMVSLELENVPGLVWRGIPLGEHDPVAMEMVRNSMPFKVVSNVVEIEVGPDDEK